MCARFSLFATPDQIAKLLDLEPEAVPPRYNIAPSQSVLAAVQRNDRRELREFRWGLIPSWAKDPKIGSRMINARSEELLDKPAFRSAFQRRRCVIPASGFFEWTEVKAEVQIEKTSASPSLFEEFDIPRRETRTVKQPHFIGLKSREPFAFAGLYEVWHSPEGEKIRSCAILTTGPNKLVAPLHDRMPVVLHQSDIGRWLDSEHVAPEEVTDLLAPYPDQEMIAFPVSRSLNDPNQDSPSLLVECAGSLT